MSYVCGENSSLCGSVIFQRPEDGGPGRRGTGKSSKRRYGGTGERQSSEKGVVGDTSVGGAAHRTWRSERLRLPATSLCLLL